jgi:hypothetical protein
VGLGLIFLLIIAYASNTAQAMMAEERMRMLAATQATGAGGTEAQSASKTATGAPE